VIKKEDIEIIVDECELTKDKAERLLRKHQGSVQDAIASFIRGEE
jgi:NACalpha-BTF3-like transcription factor